MYRLWSVRIIPGMYWSHHVGYLSYNTDKIHRIARSLGWDMGCLLWILSPVLYHDPVSAVVYAIPFGIGPRHNGTRQYIHMCTLHIPRLLLYKNTHKMCHMAHPWRRVLWVRQRFSLSFSCGGRHSVIHDCSMLRVNNTYTITYHYIDVIMTTMASQITSLTVVYSIVYSGADQRKHQSSASLAFVRGTYRDWWIPRTKGQ